MSGQIIRRGMTAASIAVRLSAHMLGVLVLVASGGFIALPAEAKPEYRDVTWLWSAGDGSHSHVDFDSAEAAVNAYNEYEERRFADCASKPSCISCTKTTYGPPDQTVNQSTIINGRYKSLTTSSGTFTQYQAACGSTPSQTTTSAATGSIAAGGYVRCPDDAQPKYKYLSTVVSDGKTFQSYRYWCQTEVPDCPKCSPPGLPEGVYGNPIDAVNGVKIQRETDYAAADGLLRVGRTYTSASGHWTWAHESTLSDLTGRGLSLSSATTLISSIKMVPSGVYYGVPVPPAVDTPRAFPLVKSEPDTGQKELWIFSETGARIKFSEDTENVFATQDVSRPQLRLVASANGSNQWQLRFQRRGYDTFDATGFLQQRAFLDGKSLSYSRSGDVTTVTAYPGGRSLVYSLDRASKRMTVTLPDSTQLLYSIDALQRVLAVTYPDGAGKTYVYNESGNTGTTESKPLWLTGTINEKQIRYSTYAYDGTRPISTALADGMNKYSVNYGSSQVTTPLNGNNTISWETGADGERRITSQSQAAGSGSASSASSVTYDSNGNIASLNDFKGSRTCYANDLTRNLETARVEGLSGSATCSSYTGTGVSLPFGARKVSTQWHPDWRLETKVAEAGRFITTVYNGQPDPFNGGAVASCAPSDALLPDGKPIAVLCKRVEQATADANGASGFSATLQSGVAARTWSYTYNRWGQVLTDDGPRTDVSDVTSYEYYSDITADHTIGDLKQVTNAAGQVVTYTKYNLHGQVLESVDANGTVSTHSYDLRQRLLSSTVGSQTTAYEYEPTGDLKKVTQPDGSWVAYGYDAARRMTGVSDSLGNGIVYTLDNAGNRTKEEVKDPGGVLARQLSRVYDALGRVQQTIGRE